MKTYPELTSCFRHLTIGIFPQFLNFVSSVDYLSSPPRRPRPPLPKFKMLDLLFRSLPKQVGQAKDELLTSQLIDHLMGESDGMPKVLKVFSPLRFSSILVMVLLYSVFIC